MQYAARGLHLHCIEQRRTVMLRLCFVREMCGCFEPIAVCHLFIPLAFSLSSAYRLVKRLGFIGKALLSQQRRRAGGSALRRFGKPFPVVPPVIRRKNRLLLQRPPYCRTIPTARPARQSQRKAHRLWSERRRQRRRAFRAALLRRRFSVCPGKRFPALRTPPEARARFSPAF